MSRQADRREHAPEVRISWLEEDLDRVDREFLEVDKKIEHKVRNLDAAIRLLADHQKDQDARIQANSDRAEAKIDGNRKVMVGVLTSTLSVAIAIVWQVLTMRGGG